MEHQDALQTNGENQHETRQEILFDLEAEQSRQASILEQEREKHRRR
jgi:hypothetical protein